MKSKCSAQNTLNHYQWSMFLSIITYLSYFTFLLGSIRVFIQFNVTVTLQACCSLCLPPFQWLTGCREREGKENSLEQEIGWNKLKLQSLDGRGQSPGKGDGRRSRDCAHTTIGEKCSLPQWSEKSKGKSCQSMACALSATTKPGPPCLFFSTSICQKATAIQGQNVSRSKLVGCQSGERPLCYFATNFCVNIHLHLFSGAASSLAWLLCKDTFTLWIEIVLNLNAKCSTTKVKGPHCWKTL